MSEIPRDSDRAALVQLIIAIGQQLKLGVVAEGVESREQEHLLTGWGCDTMQGHAFKPALPADEIVDLLMHEAASRLGNGLDPHHRSAAKL